MLNAARLDALKGHHARRISYLDISDPKLRDQSQSAIESAIEHVFGIPPERLNQGSRGVAQAALARQVAMYLAHVACGLTITEAGRLFNRDRTTAAHACILIEDRRDNLLFDRILEHLTWAVPHMVLRLRPPALLHRT